MAADEVAHVRACSTASTPACTVPDLHHFLKNTKKYRRGDVRQIPPEYAGANTPSAVHGYLPTTAVVGTTAVDLLNLVLHT
jgi:hypothetical protein